MDLLKKAKDRAQQSIGEAVGSVSKTELDADTTAALAHADDIKSSCEKLLASLKHHTQPLELTITLKQGESPTSAEDVANVAAAAGAKLTDAKNESANATLTMAEAYKKMGTAQREYYSAVGANTFGHVKSLLDVDVKALEHEKKELNNKRLDLDTIKNKKTPDPKELERVTGAFKDQQSKVHEMAKAFGTKAGAELKVHLKAYAHAEMDYHNASAALLKEAMGKM